MLGMLVAPSPLIIPLTFNTNTHLVEAPISQTVARSFARPLRDDYGNAWIRAQTSRQLLQGQVTNKRAASEMLDRVIEVIIWTEVCNLSFPPSQSFSSFKPVLVIGRKAATSSSYIKRYIPPTSHFGSTDSPHPHFMDG
jgi:hypothetical protein